MALQLKNGDNDEVNTSAETAETTGSSAVSVDDQEESKFRGGYGNGKISAEQINDLPAYTAPPVMNSGGAGVGGKAGENRTVFFRVFALIFAVVVVFAFIKIALYFTSSGGKDITQYLTKSEEEISSSLVIHFQNNPDRVSGIYLYTNREVSVKSGNELNIVYFNGKQAGVNTDSRKYRFFNVGINDALQTAEKNMTYQHDGPPMSVLNDMLGGNSSTYFYYNKKNNDCLILTVNDNTYRVVNMTYVTDFKKATETLSSSSE